MLFSIDMSKYSNLHSFCVVWPASIDKPKDNSVLFVTEKYAHKINHLRSVRNCLVFVPEKIKIDNELYERHIFIFCEQPRLEFCLFFKENNISCVPKYEEYDVINGAFVAKGAKLGKNATIMPYALICSQVEIGDDAYIGSGVRLTCALRAGDNLIVRENSVLGCDGLSFEKGSDYSNVKMPQFGGIQIGNEVEIGANVSIARGSIDYTIIGDNVKIDNMCFISHNVIIGDRCLLAAGTVLGGSTVCGSDCWFGVGVTVSNKITIGNNAYITMGSSVTRNVDDGQRVSGNFAIDHKKFIAHMRAVTR